MYVDEKQIHCPMCHEYRPKRNWLHNSIEFNKFTCPVCHAIVQFDWLFVVNRHNMKKYHAIKMHTLAIQAEPTLAGKIKCPACDTHLTDKEWADKHLHGNMYGCPGCGPVAFDVDYMLTEVISSKALEPIIQQYSAQLTEKSRTIGNLTRRLQDLNQVLAKEVSATSDAQKNALDVKKRWRSFAKRLRKLGMTPKECFEMLDKMVEDKKKNDEVQKLHPTEQRVQKLEFE